MGTGGRGGGTVGSGPRPAHAPGAYSAGRLLGVGITGDLLYPPEEVRAWTAAAGAEYREIASIHGHDAFLLEPEQVGEILRDALEQAAGESGSIAVAGEAAEVA